ncbi:MAG TPA: Nramp family divalent metal transporter [Candidatus Dormibacteraeota bacterium]|nr:Nramp family divalent metal transporter [Candidatus Dormibacteraeota bacterium]
MTSPPDDRRRRPRSGASPPRSVAGGATAEVVAPRTGAAGTALPGERRVLEAAQRSLAGEARGLRALLPFLGPAFVAAVAYVDPGNFATNVAGGSRFGYMLLWVVLAANLMAMLIQALSAKLGIATGMNLPEVCRARFPRPLNLLLWVQAEVVAMATDLAEFVGAALGLNLLFHVPLLPAGLITGAAAFAILGLQARGFRSVEAVITGLVGAIVVAFAFQVVLARPSAAGVAGGVFLPHLDGPESVLLAAGILGATVMPHVIYLHSALTQHRIVGSGPEERRRIYRFELWDVVIAMSVAGAINMAMLVTAAAVLHGRGMGVADLGAASHALGAQLGHHADLFFGLGLLASGLSSSSVGTMAGQVVMQGFIHRRIPLFLRRSLTMAPALAVLALGVDTSKVLVLSQVVLSFGIPFALIPLLLFSRDRRLMGDLVNRRSTTALAGMVVALIVGLNVFLLGQTLNLLPG